VLVQILSDFRLHSTIPPSDSPREIRSRITISGLRRPTLSTRHGQTLERNPGCHAVCGPAAIQSAPLFPPRPPRAAAPLLPHLLDLRCLGLVAPHVSSRPSLPRYCRARPRCPSWESVPSRHASPPSAHARTARVIGPHRATAHVSESALRATAYSGPFASARAAPMFHLHTPLCFAPAAPPAPPRSCFMPPARTAPALAPAMPRSLPAFALSGSALVSHQLPRACAALAFMSPCFNATRTALASVRLKPSASLLRSAHAHRPHLCTSTASPTPASRLLPALWPRLCNLFPHAPPFPLPARSPGYTPLGPSRALLHAWATNLRVTPDL
jgi:hypothetical protein